MTGRRLKLGVAGLGRAFVLMRPTLAAHPHVELVAAADPRAEARTRFSAEFGGRTYSSVEALCDDPDIEAVYVATPHEFHAQNAIAAAARGRHVLVEKPMALTIRECQSMVDAAQEAGVQLIVGHSHGFDAPIARTREMIKAAAFGRLRMITAVQFTDFLYRPRRPEELDAASGGGVLLNQAPHQVEIVRLLGGGMVKSVRALTGAWDAKRPVDGAYSALLTFEDGAFATLTYSGYAHFDSDELAGWIAESGYPKDPSDYGTARALLHSSVDELALKKARNYGGAEGPKLAESQSASRLHPHFGLVIASCDRADLRPGPEGVAIYGDESRSFEPVPVPQIPRSEVIDELYGAIFSGRPPLHSGAWSLATMEACLAMQRSAREGRDIELQHQVGLPND
jgi:phthalate 4,5-cis-dihydrodiol dehydrogenase